MARTKTNISGGARLADFLTVGFLAMNCPLDKVKQALEQHEAHSKRRRGLPHEVLVYFVMAMCLYANVAYEEVLRLVVEGLRHLLGDEELGNLIVSKGAISQARGQVGAEPLKHLYREQVRPHGPKGMPGVFYRGKRLMAIDGSCLEMPDEKANADHFGYPSSSRGDSAFPQMRFVAMVECGTHTVCHANEGNYATSEMALAGPVIDCADASMLVMADRNFYGYPFWQRATRTGAKLLFRVKGNLLLPREQDLRDGSYLCRVYPSAKDRRHQTNAIQVRVIEYTLEGVADAEPGYRLVTNWLSDEEASAHELAALYHQRWTIEQTFDEMKTHLAERALTLRSKRPQLVLQEFYAWLLVHAAIRRMMTQAAAASAQAAQDLSFIHAVRVLKRRLPACIAIPPCAAPVLA
jgi:hypothetical protein